MRGFVASPSPREREQAAQARSMIGLLKTLDQHQPASYRRRVAEAVREMAEDLVRLSTCDTMVGCETSTLSKSKPVMPPNEIIGRGPGDE